MSPDPRWVGLKSNRLGSVDAWSIAPIPRPKALTHTPRPLTQPIILRGQLSLEDYLLNAST